MSSIRRYYLDSSLSDVDFSGKVLDVGGKKQNVRGTFRPDLRTVESWEYVNIDPAVSPDYCCSAENIPVVNSTYDNVLLCEVLEHLEKPENVLKECCRVLKPGGKLIISVPFLFPVHADPHDYQRWTAQKLDMELTTAGFAQIAITPMGGAYGVLFDILWIRFGSLSSSKFWAKCRRKALRLLKPLFLFLDKQFPAQNDTITSGYFVMATRNRAE